MQKTLLILFLFFCKCLVFGQNKKPKSRPPTTVNLPQYYKPQADSIRKFYKLNGFELLIAEFIVMESSYERAIILALEADTWYEFVFISDKGAHTQEVFLYDEAERKVLYKKKKWADVDGNIIDEAYIPRHSEYHMLKFVQECRKKRWLTTGFLLFKNKYCWAKYKV